ncbi:MAG: acyl-CoA dehydrogenase [Gammaproteobacteria bacterium]|nr:acyl-CoA dehydrogenase [Gammaproteobacteria bacterium]
MPELLTPELSRLRDEADAFARDVLAPLATEFPASRKRIIDASKAAGLFFMTQPRAFGGSEASTLAMTVARDTLASHNLSHLPVFGPGPGVLAGVGEPLKSSHLAPLMAGKKRGAFAFTEPDDAPHPTSGRIEGNTLTINGQKSYVTGGDQADFITALVEVEGGGPAMVVIDTDAAGVRTREVFSSLDGTQHSWFEFDNVCVPAAHIVGKPGEGLPRALRQIGDVRISVAAESVGLMRWVLDYLTAHLEVPHRSGTPLGRREGVRLRYADLRIKAYAARSMVYRTSRLADAGENTVNEAIACKVFATETVGEVVDTAIQLVGGRALTVGHPLETLYRRVRALRLAEGANDILRLNLARGRLDLDKGRI